MIKSFNNFLNEMYYEDLTQYVYSGYNYPDCVNIGWLEKGIPFEKGDVPSGFVDKLKKLPPLVYFHGYHDCDFCGEEHTCFNMMAIGEDETIYITPGMIDHYVEKHNYKPPQEFIDAVMTMDMTEKEARQVLNNKMKKQMGDLPFSGYMDKIKIK